MSALDVAIQYITRGWAPVPVPYKGKNPGFNGWEKLRITENTAPQYFNGAKMNIGVLLGEPSHDLADVDLDCPETLKLAKYFLPETDARFGREGSPESHWLFVSALRPAQFKEPGTNDMLVELRATGQQSIFPGSTHESGEEIEWAAVGDPAEVHPANLRARVAELAACALLARHWPQDGGRHDGQLTTIAFLIRAGWTVEKTARFVALASWAAGAAPDYQKRRATAEDAARRLGEGEKLRGWTSFKELFGEPIAKKAAGWLGIKIEAGIKPADDPGLGGLTEDQLALDFTRRHGDALRYVALWGQWLHWTGARWEREPTLAAFDLARAICREAAGRLDDDKAKIASAGTVAAVERLAKADRKHAAVVDQWDAHDWHLNTPGGIVDLTTGEVRPHDRAEHHTKITAVAPDGECPLWRTFLETVTGGDKELRAFLQRIAGYALTGSIREHALFFAYGTGANGKGVFINTLTGILGDYATVASMETFTASQTDRHPTDLAMLRGARLVTAQETEEGRRWAENKIKALTGGDPITARFMRQDFFTYSPRFKLLIAGNHKPAITHVDEAIKRRLYLIPFTVTIPPEERDRDLPEKLKAEWSGILGWMIEGCARWRRDGLKPPQCVTKATAEYLEDEDLMGQWIAEQCTTAPDPPRDPERLGYLLASWKRWCEDGNHRPTSRKRFQQNLRARGFGMGRDGANLATVHGLWLR